MFRKESGAGQPLSGPQMMFASMLKSIGLEPGAIEALSRGLLTDIKTVAGMAPEILARQEHILKCTLAQDEARFPNAWEEYLAIRRGEFHGPAETRSSQPPALEAPNGNSDSDASAGAGAVTIRPINGG